MIRSCTITILMIYYILVYENNDIETLCFNVIFLQVSTYMFKCKLRRNKDLIQKNFCLLIGCVILYICKLCEGLFSELFSDLGARGDSGAWRPGGEGRPRIFPGLGSEDEPRVLSRPL